MSIAWADRAATVAGRVAWVALTVLVAIGGYGAYNDNYTAGYAAKDRELREAARSRAPVTILDSNGNELVINVSNRY